MQIKQQTHSGCIYIKTVTLLTMILIAFPHKRCVLNSNFVYFNANDKHWALTKSSIYTLKISRCGNFELNFFLQMGRVRWLESLVFLVSLTVICAQIDDFFDLRGPYCETNNACCNGRQDHCSVPILGKAWWFNWQGMWLKTYARW